MNRCRIKKGFFVLRPCGAQARSACPSCHRMICDAHRAADSSKGWCVECMGRQTAREDKSVDDSDTWTEGSYSAFYAYRYLALAQGEVHPLGMDDGFDSYDARAFDVDLDSGGFGDDDLDTSFVDS